MLTTAFGQADDHADALRDLQNTLAFALKSAAFMVDLSAAALGDPVDKIKHVAPARGGEFFAVFAVKQVLLVANVFEPLHEQRLGFFTARGVARSVFQVVHFTAKFVQRVHRLALHHTGQAG